MVSDPSALLLLKYRIPRHKKIREIKPMGQYMSQLGTWSGSGGLHMLFLLKMVMLMFIFVAFNVES